MRLRARIRRIGRANRMRRFIAAALCWLCVAGSLYACGGPDVVIPGSAPIFTPTAEGGGDNSNG